MNEYLRSIERYIAELERESFKDLQACCKDIVRKRFVERNGPLLPKLADLAHTLQASELQGEHKQVSIAYDETLKLLGTQAEDLIEAGTALNILDQDLRNNTVQYVHQLLRRSAQNGASFPYQNFFRRLYVQGPSRTLKKKMSGKTRYIIHTACG